jgi:hypothetical protein
MNNKAIKVRKGENIREAWDRLGRWVESLKVIPNNEIKVDYTKNGTLVTVMRSTKSHNHPFKTYGSAKTLKVTSGMVNGIVPYIYDELEKVWRRIDNRDNSGNRYGKDLPAPGMQIQLNQAKDKKFYICIEVDSNDQGAINDPQKDLRIVQSETAEGLGGKKGYYPIALCYLNDSQTEIDQIFQIVHHNIRYIKQTKNANGGEATGNQHLFFPV